MTTNQSGLGPPQRHIQEGGGWEREEKKGKKDSAGPLKSAVVLAMLPRLQPFSGRKKESTVMSIPKRNGIAEMMRGRRQLHVRGVLYFSEDGGPSGEKHTSLSRYSCQPPAEGAPTLGSRAAMYKRAVRTHGGQVTCAHTHTRIMPPKAPELKARSVGS